MSDNSTRPLKRKRKTYSCVQCRQQKLKCDRATPTCGRCVAAGHASACSYENAGRESNHRDSLPVNGHGQELQNQYLSHERRGPPPNTQAPIQNGERSDPATQRFALSSKVLVPSQNTEDVTTSQYQLDGTNTGTEPLEDRQTSGIWKGPQQQQLRVLDSSHADDTLASEQAEQSRKHRDPMIFRGRRFSTQYLGATSPISQIAYVRPSFEVSFQKVLLTPLATTSSLLYSASWSKRSPRTRILRRSNVRSRLSNCSGDHSSRPYYISA